MKTIVLAWLGLLLLLAVEAGATLAHAGWIAWAAAPLMLVVVALAFMHAARASNLSRIFALAGLFWVGVLLTLGTVDYFARKDILIPPPQPGLRPQLTPISATTTP